MCRDRNKREYRKVSPRQWWQPGSQDSEHDSQDSIRMRWKKNRKVAWVWVWRPRRGAAYAPRFDESGEPIKSAGEASRRLACDWACARRRAQLMDKTGRVGPSASFWGALRRKAAQAAALIR